MESNDTASGMPYMAYIRHKKEYVNIPPQGACHWIKYVKKEYVWYKKEYVNIPLWGLWKGRPFWYH